MPLTAEQRKALPDSDFAVPAKRAFPLVDARHVKMAWSQLMRASGLSSDEVGEAKKRIVAKATELGVDTADMTADGDAGLYVRRNLTAASAAALTEWATSNGFTNLTPPHEMHATVVYSRKAIVLPPEGGDVTADPGARSVATLGDKGAVVLFFEAQPLTARWEAARSAGATWDHDGYTPHVTITYDARGLDLSGIAPFDGDITFGPEVHEALNETWAEDKGLRLSASSVRFEGEGLEAMALAMPDADGHPNRMPFSGILTRLDTPSDRPPGGSKGKRVILTKAAAERALPSLMGMAVNFVSTQDGHDVTRKVGIFTAATIEGDAVQVDGFLYARDFPKETSRIRTDKDHLGFSWELADIYVESLDADPLVITAACFTGAAILRKDKAAYASTSLAAAAEDMDMTKEELAEVMAAAMGPVTAALAEIKTTQTTQGDAVAALQAATEKKPEPTKEPDADLVKLQTDLASASTKIADLEAAAAKNVKEPERKTLSPAISSLLARADLTMPEGDAKFSLGKVDSALAKTGLTTQQRIQLKNELQRVDAL
jgi:hypothetical protein